VLFIIHGALRESIDEDHSEEVACLLISASASVKFLTDTNFFRKTI
jgi:hypothetical protein